jgi:hypothetical protein
VGKTMELACLKARIGEDDVQRVMSSGIALEGRAYVFLDALQ